LTETLAFKSTPSSNPCTKGVNAYYDSSDEILYLDTQGLFDGAIDDMKMVALSAMISDLFMYNVETTINTNNISRISEGLSLAERLMKESSLDSPTLLWVERDAYLDLDMDNSNSYLEKKLSLRDGATPALIQYNSVRRVIRDFFPIRHCERLIKPATDFVLNGVFELERAAARAATAASTPGSASVSRVNVLQSAMLHGMGTTGFSSAAPNISNMQVESGLQKSTTAAPIAVTAATQILANGDVKPAFIEGLQNIGSFVKSLPRENTKLAHWMSNGASISDFFKHMVSAANDKKVPNGGLLAQLARNLEKRAKDEFNTLYEGVIAKLNAQLPLYDNSLKTEKDNVLVEINDILTEKYPRLSKGALDSFAKANEELWRKLEDTNSKKTKEDCDSMKEAINNKFRNNDYLAIRRYIALGKDVASAKTLFSQEFISTDLWIKTKNNSMWAKTFRELGLTDTGLFDQIWNRVSVLIQAEKKNKMQRQIEQETETARKRLIEQTTEQKRREAQREAGREAQRAELQGMESMLRWERQQENGKQQDRYKEASRQNIDKMQKQQEEMSLNNQYQIQQYRAKIAAEQQAQRDYLQREKDRLEKEKKIAQAENERIWLLERDQRDKEKRDKEERDKDNSELVVGVLAIALGALMKNSGKKNNGLFFNPYYMG
jgi:hypothetical protein